MVVDYRAKMVSGALLEKECDLIRDDRAMHEENFLST